MRLTIRDLEKEYDGLTILNGAGYTFEQGKAYGIISRKGAGKTTFLNCINGEINSYKGDIYLVQGNYTSKVSYRDCTTLFPNPVLPEFMTGYEYVKYYMDINGVNTDIAKPQDYLNKVELEPADQNRLIKEYTIEMKNSVLMAAMYAAAPAIILMDEPFKDVGIPSANVVKEAINELKKDHIVIVAVHDISRMGGVFDELVVLEHGEFTGIDKSIIDECDFSELYKDR